MTSVHRLVPRFFALWLLLGLFFAVETRYLGFRQGVDRTLASVLVWELGNFVLWAALAPLIAAFGRRWPLIDERWLLNGFIHLGLGLAVSVIEIVSITTIDFAIGINLCLPEPFLQHLDHMITPRLVYRSVFYFLILCVSQMLTALRRAHERELRAVALDASLARSRVQLLTLQLQPHFLFNTLQNVIALMNDGSATRATSMLGSLGDLLRRSLANRDRQEVPLAEELEFLASYLEIEQTRHGDRLRLIVSVPAEVSGAYVPMLILQPLVENALRHGIAVREGEAEVTISVRRKLGYLVLRISDRGPGVAAALPGHGVGLANTRARLEELYGSSQRLRLRPRSRGGVEVSVLLPWKTEPGGRDSLFEERRP